MKNGVEITLYHGSLKEEYEDWGTGVCSCKRWRSYEYKEKWEGGAIVGVNIMTG